MRRGAKRARTDRADLYAVLDAGLVGHLGVVLDGAPVVLPTGYGRHEDTLYLHGSTGAATLRAAAAGGPVCFTVTHLDGIVYARSAFHHSMNYRVRGRARDGADGRRRRRELLGLRVLTEQLAPGSWAATRRARPARARRDRGARPGPRRGQRQDPDRPARGRRARPPRRGRARPGVGRRAAVHDGDRGAGAVPAAPAGHGRPAAGGRAAAQPAGVTRSRASDSSPLSVVR